MVISMSAPMAASPTDPIGRTPCSAAALTAGALRSNPRTSWPARTRFAVIGTPMWPSPTQAIVAIRPP